jgi:hypothetical protein
MLSYITSGGKVMITPGPKPWYRRLYHFITRRLETFIDEILLSAGGKFSGIDPAKAQQFVDASNDLLRDSHVFGWPPPPKGKSVRLPSGQRAFAAIEIYPPTLVPSNGGIATHYTTAVFQTLEKSWTPRGEKLYSYVDEICAAFQIPRRFVYPVVAEHLQTVANAVASAFVNGTPQKTAPLGLIQSKCLRGDGQTSGVPGFASCEIDFTLTKLGNAIATKAGRKRKRKANK